MTRRRSILPGALLICLVLGAAQAGDRWYAVETPHVRVLSNASPTKAADIAGQLEIFRVAIDKTWRGLTRPLPEKVTVFAFKDDASFAAYKALSEKPGERVLGVTLKDDEGFVIALSVTRPQAIENTRVFKSFQYPYAAVFHEYAHHLLGATISKLPAWVNEGMAEYASSFVIQAGRAELGRVRYAELPWLKDGFPMAPDDLIRLPSFVPLGSHARDVAYKESWLLVFYLTQHGTPRAGQFGAFLSALLAGTPPGDALSFSFQATPDQLAREAREFFLRRSYKFTTVSVADVETPTANDVEIVSNRDSELALADLAVKMRTNLGAAEATYRRVLAETPADVRALAGLGLLLERQGRLNDAEASYRRALETDPSGFTAQFRLGRLMAKGASELGSALPAPPTSPIPPRALEARDHLTAALLVQPSHAASLYFFGTTYLSDPGDRTAGIAALQAVLQVQPENFDAAARLARLQRWSGDRVSAIAALSGTASLHATPQDVDGLRYALLECDRLELQQLAKDDGREAAGAWADRAIAETRNAAMVEQLRKWRDVVLPSPAQP